MVSGRRMVSSGIGVRIRTTAGTIFLMRYQDKGMIQSLVIITKLTRRFNYVAKSNRKRAEATIP